MRQLCSSASAYTDTHDKSGVVSENKSDWKYECDKINAAAVVISVHVTQTHRHRHTDTHAQSHCQARIVNRGAMQQNAVSEQAKINWFQ